VRHVIKLLTLASIAAIVAAGCGSDGGSDGGCHDFLVSPGTLILQPGIQVAIRNSQGQSIAQSAHVDALNGGPPPAVSRNPDSLSLDVYVNPGTYSLGLSAPFYRDTTLADIRVISGDCGTVQPTKLNLVLQTAAGAPPVRSVALFGGDFLATPGSRTRMVAIVDANAGVSRALAWRVSDTTMATIDQTGLVTSKCSIHGGVDTVTATSIVDPTVSGRNVVGIGASGSC
jgi:hypothetical protein